MSKRRPFKFRGKVNEVTITHRLLFGRTERRRSHRGRRRHGGNGKRRIFLSNGLAMLFRKMKVELLILNRFRMFRNNLMVLLFIVRATRTMMRRLVINIFIRRLLPKIRTLIVITVLRKRRNNTVFFHMITKTRRVGTPLLDIRRMSSLISHLSNRQIANDATLMTLRDGLDRGIANIKMRRRATTNKVRRNMRTFMICVRVTRNNARNRHLIAIPLRIAGEVKVKEIRRIAILMIRTARHTVRHINKKILYSEGRGTTEVRIGIRRISKNMNHRKFRLYLARRTAPRMLKSGLDNLNRLIEARRNLRLTIFNGCRNTLISDTCRHVSTVLTACRSLIGVRRSVKIGKEKVKLISGRNRSAIKGTRGTIIKNVHGRRVPVIMCRRTANARSTSNLLFTNVKRLHQRGGTNMCFLRLRINIRLRSTIIAHVRSRRKNTIRKRVAKILRLALRTRVLNNRLPFKSMTSQYDSELFMVIMFMVNVENGRAQPLKTNQGKRPRYTRRCRRNRRKRRSFQWEGTRAGISFLPFV